MCIRSGGAFNMADLEIGEHVCKKQKVIQGAMDLWKQKKIISIVVCDVLALRSQRKESLKHLIFSDFFWEPKHVCTFLFFSPRGKQDILKAFCFNE